MTNLPFPETAIWLSVADVASLLRVSTKSVRRWIKAGILPATKLGRDWRIARTDLRAVAAASGNRCAAYVL